MMIPLQKSKLKHSTLSIAIAAALTGGSLHAAPEILLDNYSLNPGETLEVGVSLDADIATYGDDYGIEAFSPIGSCYLTAGYDAATATITSLVGQNFGTAADEDTPILWTPSGTSDPFATLDLTGCSSGIYRVRVHQGAEKNNSDPAYNGTDDFTTFVINPGASKQEVLVLDSLTSRVGRTNYGGKSLFAYNSSADTAATQVEILRPMGQDISLLELSEWLNAEGIGHDVMSIIELGATGAAIPSEYKVLVIVGRNDLWDDNMVATIGTFRANGGHIMFLGAETMRYKATIGGGKLISDTEDDATERTATDLFATTGLSHSAGGFVNDNGSGFLPAGAGNDNGAYKVGNASHWIYNGISGISNGGIIGKDDLIVGPSVDGAAISVSGDGTASISGSDNASQAFEVVAWADAQRPNSATVDGTAVAGILPGTGGAGWIFNAGTMRWVKGLKDLDTGAHESDPVIGQMTKNVINAFTTDQALVDGDGDGYIKLFDEDDADPNVQSTASSGGSNGSSGGSTSGSTDGSDTTGGDSTTSSGGGGGGSTGFGLLGLMGLAALRRKFRS